MSYVTDLQEMPYASFEQVERMRKAMVLCILDLEKELKDSQAIVMGQYKPLSRHGNSSQVDMIKMLSERLDKVELHLAALSPIPTPVLSPILSPEEWAAKHGHKMVGGYIKETPIHCLWDDVPEMHKSGMYTFGISCPCPKCSPVC